MAHDGSGNYDGYYGGGSTYTGNNAGQDSIYSGGGETTTHGAVNMDQVYTGGVSNSAGGTSHPTASGGHAPSQNVYTGGAGNTVYSGGQNDTYTGGADVYSSGGTQPQTQPTAPQPATQERSFFRKVTGALGISAFRSHDAIAAERRNSITTVPESAMDRKMAQAEHSLEGLGMCASLQEIQLRTGEGVVWYFRFCRYLWALNGILLVLGLISFFKQMKELSDLGANPDVPEYFYISTYLPGTHDAWLVSSIFAFVFMCSWPIAYRWYVGRVRAQTAAAREAGDEDYIEDPFEGMYGADGNQHAVDKIEYAEQYSRKSLCMRKLASLGAFVALLGVQGGLNYLLLEATENASSTISSVILSVVVKIINIIWLYVGRFLTRFEKHANHSDEARWLCFKLFLFKVCNLMVLLVVKRLEISESRGDCPLEAMASQFVMVVLVDVTINTAWELCAPKLWNCCCRSGQEEEARGGWFNLADEYTELIYRQFVVGLGFFLCPVLLPILALLGAVLEYYVDKYRLIFITRAPKRTKHSFKNVITGFFILTLLCTIAWGVMTLSGTAGVKDNDQCIMFQ